MRKSPGKKGLQEEEDNTKKLRLISNEITQLLDEPGSGGGDHAYSVTWLHVLIVFAQFLSGSCSVPEKDLSSLFADESL